MTKKSTEIYIEKVKKEYQKSKSKAEKLLQDKEKTKSTIDKAIKKAEKVKGPIEKAWNQLQLMFLLIKDYISKDYKDIPFGSIVAVVAGIIYFLSPVDVIPDFIPGIGYIDDLFVLSIVYVQVSVDLEKYANWRNGQIS